MCPMLASRRGGQLANGGGFDGTGSTAAAASRIDLHGMTQGGNPHVTQPVEPGRPVTTSAAFWNAATGGRASAIPASTEALAIFDASSQHAQETPSERESTGGAPAAFSTSAVGTPSGATEHPANERHGTFDDGEDASGREEKGTDGKGKNHMEQPMACPYYILNPQLHQGCRYIALWEPSAVTHHIKRSHKEPKTFCPTCLDVFKSQRALDTHRNRLTPCSLVPFDHHWATSEALDKLDKLPKYGRDDTRTKWHAKYKAMFGDTPSRHQIFCFASAQDMVDELPKVRKSSSYLKFGHSLRSLGIQDPERVWAMVLDLFLRYFTAQEKSWTSRADQHADLQSGSSSPAPQPVNPGTAPQVFGSPSAGPNAQGMPPPMPTLGFQSAPDNRTINESFDMRFSAARTTQSPFNGITTNSTDFPMGYGIGHGTSQGLAAQTATTAFGHYPNMPQMPLPSQAITHPQGFILESAAASTGYDAGYGTFQGPAAQMATTAFGHYPNMPQMLLPNQATTGSFWQDFGMAPQTGLPPQMPIDARRYGATPGDMQSAPNPGQGGQGMELDGGPASFSNSQAHPQ